MRRIKHRIGAFLLAMLVCLSLVIPVYADTDGFAEEYYRLNDMAELLSDNEDQELQTRLDEVSQRQKVRCDDNDNVGSGRFQRERLRGYFL